MNTFASHLRSANHYYDRNLREWALSVALAPMALYLCLQRGSFTLLDHASLLIHEAGHLVFSLFPDTVYILGGTLMQLIVPVLIAVHFLQSMYRPGVQVGLFWLGQNFVNISVYAADAEAKRLPLLGGEASRHDWNVLLSRAGLLEHAPEVGNLVFIVAIAVFGFAVLLPMVMWHVGDEEEARRPW